MFHLKIAITDARKEDMNAIPVFIQIVYVGSLISAFLLGIGIVVYILTKQGLDSSHVYGGNILIAIICACIVFVPLFFERMYPNSPQFPTDQFAGFYWIVFGVNLVLSLVFVFFMYKERLSKLLFFYPLFILLALISSAWAAKTVDVLSFIFQTGNVLAIILIGLAGLLYLLTYICVPAFFFWNFIDEKIIPAKKI